MTKADRSRPETATAATNGQGAAPENLSEVTDPKVLEGTVEGHVPPEPDPPANPDLANGPLSRWAVMALVVTLIGAAAGFVGALVWPPTYAARANILYEISQEKPTGFLREDRSLTTQLVLLQSRQVLGPVAAAEGMPVEDLENKVTATLLDSSEVIQVEARAGSREEAQARTQGIIDGYLAGAERDANASVETFLREQLTAVRDDLAAARTESERQREIGTLSTSGNQSSEYSAEVRVQNFEDREQELLTQLDEVNTVRLTASRPEVIVAPYPVADAVSPRPGFATATGGLTGLVIAAALIGFLAHHRNRASTW